MPTDFSNTSDTALKIIQSDLTREHKIRDLEIEVNERTNPYAAYWLGVFHEEDGRYQQAGVWFGTAVVIAELPEAQYKLGTLASENDAVTAVEWYRLAAAQEYPPAFLALGTAFWTGVGVEKDVPKSYDYFLKAAERGLASAQYLVGVYFDEGRLGPSDPVLSHQWFTMAAHRGVMDAQFKLAVHFAYGVGCVRDFVAAYAWAIVCATGLRRSSTSDPEKSAALESLHERLLSDGPANLESQAQPVWRALISSGCLADCAAEGGTRNVAP